MNVIKQRVMVLMTALVMMLSVCSLVSAEQQYWNGDTNYPLCYSKMGGHAYVDLSSAYIAEENSENMIIKYNVVSVAPDGGDTEIYTVAILLQGTEDGYDRYVLRNGQWKELTNSGVDSLALKSSCLVTDYFHIKG